jgi:hypothetical protein
MTHRSFVDSDGCRWRVWDVSTAGADRRANDRRRWAASDPIIERRRNTERRQRDVPRQLFLNGFNDGWLCFEHDTDRRRHAPVPPDWTSWSEQQLEECCRAARPVTRRATSS